MTSWLVGCTIGSFNTALIGRDSTQILHSTMLVDSKGRRISYVLFMKRILYAQGRRVTFYIGLNVGNVRWNLRIERMMIFLGRMASTDSVA